MKKVSGLKMLRIAIGSGVAMFCGALFAGESVVQYSAPVCQSVPAIAYTVTYLEGACGAHYDNSGLRGVWNRRHKCADEIVYAKVVAAANFCETCGTASRVAEIRCERGNCGVCENQEYINALVMDLASPSKRVRHAAEKSLEKCGLRVTKDKICGQTQVPAWYFYE